MAREASSRVKQFYKKTLKKTIVLEKWSKTETDSAVEEFITTKKCHVTVVKVQDDIIAKRRS